MLRADSPESARITFKACAPGAGLTGCREGGADRKGQSNAAKVACGAGRSASQGSGGGGSLSAGAAAAADAGDSLGCGGTRASAATAASQPFPRGLRRCKRSTGRREFRASWRRCQSGYPLSRGAWGIQPDLAAVGRQWAAQAAGGREVAAFTAGHQLRLRLGRRRRSTRRKATTRPRTRPMPVEGPGGSRTGPRTTSGSRAV